MNGANVEPPSMLKQIVATKRREVAEAKRARPTAELQAAARRMVPARDFYRAVAQPPPAVQAFPAVQPLPAVQASLVPRLIAELKKASPSAGLIRADFDPVEIAGTYARCGAAALSVLTDRAYFQGELAFIEAVKDAAPLPVLRKDFIIDEYQVVESRAAGADAILLVAALLTPEQIGAWSAAADALGMSVLVEIHTLAELRGVREFVRADRRVLLGINNRDLHTQTTDLGTTARLAAELGPGVPFVSESGIKTRADVRFVQGAGAAAVLIGETFMRAADIGAKVRELMG
jgi:indole-3-glycerol phosphate synthase